MTSEVTFRNSLDEDLYIESWIEATHNFKSESSVKQICSDLTKINTKVDKKNIFNVINKKRSSKNKKVVCRKLPDNYNVISDISGGGRASLILKKNDR